MSVHTTPERFKSLNNRSFTVSTLRLGPSKLRSTPLVVNVRTSYRSTPFRKALYFSERVLAVWDFPSRPKISLRTSDRQVPRYLTLGTFRRTTISTHRLTNHPSRELSLWTLPSLSFVSTRLLYRLDTTFGLCPELVRTSSRCRFLSGSLNRTQPHSPDPEMCGCN